MLFWVSLTNQQAALSTDAVPDTTWPRLLFEEENDSDCLGSSTSPTKMLVTGQQEQLEEQAELLSIGTEHWTCEFRGSATETKRTFWSAKVQWTWTQEPPATAEGEWVRFNVTVEDFEVESATNCLLLCWWIERLCWSSHGGETCGHWCHYWNKKSFTAGSSAGFSWTILMGASRR